MQPPPPPPPPPPQTSFHPARVEEGGHSPDKPQPTGLVFCLNFTHNFTQICLGGVIVSALFIVNLADDLTNSLALHILLCTVGYFILMAQAIISFSPFGWANNLKFENKRIIHLVMQIMGSALAITGSVIRLADSDDILATSHGICGFIAMLLTAVSLVGGVLNLIFPKQLSNKISKILHSCVGTVTISFAFVSLIFAFHVYYRDVAGDANANSAILLTMFAMVGSTLMAMVKNIKRLLP